VTSGVTAHRASRPERSIAFNPLTSLGLGEGKGVRNSRPFTRFPEAFGPTLVQAARSADFKTHRDVPVALVTVREAAARLRVSPVTVYRLCGEGKLKHSRVSNAVRIDSAEVDRFLRTGAWKG
jgi:excisionase family DNA binding protein